MFWIISAIVVLLAFLLTLGNLYENEGSYKNPDWKKLKMPRWAWILIVLGCLVPILNLAGLITLIIWLIVDIADDDDYELRGPIGKFISFLTKKV